MLPWNCTDVVAHNLSTLFANLLEKNILLELCRPCWGFFWCFTVLNVCRYIHALITAFESHFHFHSSKQLPRPERFRPSRKSYPSKHPHNKGKYFAPVEPSELFYVNYRILFEVGKVNLWFCDVLVLLLPYSIRISKHQFVHLSRITCDSM